METAIKLPMVAVDGWTFEAIEFPFLECSSREFLSGYELARYIESMNNLAGRPHVNRLLIRQELIPDAWHQIVPVFAGTIEYGRFGFLGFSILAWCPHYRRWYKDKRWFGFCFHKKECRLVRLVPALAKHLVSPSP
jgi:hypothetical protein